MHYQQLKVMQWREYIQQSGTVVIAVNSLKNDCDGLSTGSSDRHHSIVVTVYIQAHTYTCLLRKASETSINRLVSVESIKSWGGLCDLRNGNNTWLFWGRWGEITEMEILHDQWLTNNLALEVYWFQQLPVHAAEIVKSLEGSRYACIMNRTKKWVRSRH